MSSALRQPMNLDDFLTWEREQEFRWEFDGIAPVAMTGGTLGDRAIADRIAQTLAGPLSRRGCSVFAGDVKILVAGRVRYPDMVVTCAPVDMASDIVPEPVVVVEVLSPSTARTDRFLKLEEYRRTPSIAYFLLIEQASRDVLCLSLDGERWIARAASGRDEVELAALGLTLTLDDIYGGSDPDATERSSGGS